MFLHCSSRCLSCLNLMSVVWLQQWPDLCCELWASKRKQHKDESRLGATDTCCSLSSRLQDLFSQCTGMLCLNLPFRQIYSSFTLISLSGRLRSVIWMSLHHLFLGVLQILFNMPCLHFAFFPLVFNFIWYFAAVCFVVYCKLIRFMLDLGSWVCCPLRQGFWQRIINIDIIIFICIWNGIPFWPCKYFYQAS